MVQQTDLQLAHNQGLMRRWPVDHALRHESFLLGVGADRPQFAADARMTISTVSRTTHEILPLPPLIAKTLLGITKAKKRIKKELGICVALGRPTRETTRLYWPTSEALDDVSL